MKKRLFAPDKVKVLIALAFVVLFWFFPIISKSLFAYPFFNAESLVVSLLLNVAIAYVFGCLIGANLKKTRMLIVVIVIILAVYLLLPKVSQYGIGDVGGAKDKYCDCYGFEKYSMSCCYSSVTYCVGICMRHEKTSFFEFFGG